MSPSLEQQLADLLGRDAAVDGQRLPQYSVDGATPRVAVQPASRDEVAEILRWASSKGLAVIPCGGGTQLSLGNPPRRVDLLLDLTRLDQVLDFQPADLTVTVESGVTLAQLQELLAAEGKIVPLEAPLSHRATVGGVLAANTCGPLRSSYGLPRDWLIGIGVISSQGVETKAGGRVVKNVTGYDLNKLYTGSLGTLGVIVEASFKLAPRPTAWGCLAAEYSGVGKALAGANALRGQVHAPQAIQVINGPIARILGNAHTGVGQAAEPSGPGAGAQVLAFYFGRSLGVRRSMEGGRQQLEDTPARRIQQLGEDETLALVRSLTDLGWSPDTAPDLVLKVNLPPSAMAQASTAFWGDDSLGVAPGIVADVGWGEMRLLWKLRGGDDFPVSGVAAVLAAETAVDAVRRARELAGRLGGSAVVEQCPLPVKQQLDVWGDSFQGMEIMRRIKNKFDPSGTLNPGRFVGRL